MKNLLRFCGALLLVALGATGVSAQTTIDQTTLSAAITTTNANVIVLASVTCTGCTFSGANGGTLIYTASGEAMRVAGSYTSGTTVPVMRGTDGTKASTHPSGELVFVGAGTRFGGTPQGINGVTIGVDSNGDPGGSCTRTSILYIPYINLSKGRVWDCVNSLWVLGFTDPGAAPGVIGRTAVANTNYTILNTDYIVTFSSITGAKTLTLPSAVINPGKVIIIVDELGILSASTSITVTATAGSVNAVSSLTMSVPYTVLRFYSNGTHWWGW